MPLFHKFPRDNHVPDCLFKVSSLWIWAEIWWFSRIIPNIPRRALLEFSANGLKGWNAANILREPGRILRETRGNTAESSQKCLKWLEKLIPLNMKAYNLWDEWRKMMKYVSYLVRIISWATVNIFCLLPSLSPVDCVRQWSRNRYLVLMTLLFFIFIATLSGTQEHSLARNNH